MTVEMRPMRMDFYSISRSSSTAQKHYRANKVTGKSVHEHTLYERSSNNGSLEDINHAQSGMTVRRMRGEN
jgi:hypothetical protein